MFTSILRKVLKGKTRSSEITRLPLRDPNLRVRSDEIQYLMKFHEEMRYWPSKSELDEWIQKMKFTNQGPHNAV